MFHPRRNQDCGEGLYDVLDAIELHFSSASQERADVDFRVFSVKMGLGIQMNICQVHSSREIRIIRECSSRHTTGAILPLVATSDR